MPERTSRRRKTVRETKGKNEVKRKDANPATDLARQLKIEQALYEIADAASAVTDLPSFYKRLHEIVGTLMYAGNFFIATYDEQTGLISWPYQVDEVEPPHPPAPLADFHGLTSWVIRTGQVARHGWDLSNELLASGEISFPDVGTANEDGIGVPLKADGKTIGVVMVQSYTKGVEYTDQDEQVLEFVAQHIAVALTRARAMEETRQRNYELQIINSVQEGLASQLDIQAIFNLVGDMICEIFKSDSAGIFTYDRETNLEYFPYLMQRGRRLFQEPLPLDEKGFSPLVMHTRQPIMINEHLAERSAEVGAFLLGGAEMQGSCIYVPLVLGEEARGVIVISADREHAFTDSDLRLLSTLANSMSIALENARLFEETQRLLKETEDRAAELQIINSVQEGLASKLEMQEIYDLVGDKIREIFDANTVTLATFDFEKNLMHPHYAFEKGQRFFIEPLPVPEVYGEFIQRAQPLLINRNLDEYVRRLDPGARPLAGEMPKSVLAVPLIMNGILSGIITLQNIDRENAFGESDLRLLQTLANSMSVALENARLFDETQQRNAELQIINSVQAALAAHLDIHGIYEAVGEKLREIFNYQDGGIYSADLKTHVMTIEYGFEKGQKVERLSVPMNSLYEFLVATDEYFVFNGDFPQFAAQFKDYQVPVGELPKSALVVPVPRKRDADLAVLLGMEDVNGRRIFTESDVRLLQTLANSMSVALENARLFNETQERNSELAILNSVGEAMAKTLDVKTVTKIVGDKVRDIFSADQMGILLFEQQAQLIHVLYGYDKAHDRYVDETMIKPLPLGKGLTSKVIELRQPLLLSTREEQDGYGHYMPPELVGQIRMSESWLGVPIMVDEDVFGAVFVEDYRPHAYNENHLRLLQTLSSNMGVAIQNARLFDETQQRNAELAIINSVQEGLASKLEMQEIYELVGEKLREVFQQADLSISVYDPETDMLSVPFCVERGQRIPFPAIRLNGRGIIGHMLADPKSMLFDTEDEMRRAFAEYQSADITGGGVPNSALYVPLMTLAPGARAGVGGSMRGAVVLEDLQNEHAFKESDVRLLDTLTDSMSVALENARLWEQEKMYRKALERELEIGREIQAGFLPEELPAIQGWEIAASLMSAREVAGDFYDAFELPDGNIGIVIADVCDKGVGAALFMTLFRSLIRAVSNLDYFENLQASLPHSAVERLQRAVLLTNNYIAETHGKSGMFATLFFGILDPGTGRLIYINGGHELPFILRCDNVYETLRKTGPAVGIVTNPSFEISETQLQAGDVFFAFTDGVPDCQNPQGEFFGRERLSRVFQKESGSAHQLVKATETELHQFINGGTQFDDITLLAVKRG